MQGKRLLTSIPEKNEAEEEVKISKWVPKKKHEVLKAKYKCLKKLFQIYDASVIGILPDPSDTHDQYDEDKTYRRKRSRRTKTDACAGTSEISSGDITDNDKSMIAATVIRDLNIQCSCSTQVLNQKAESSKVCDSVIPRSKETVIRPEKECECTQTVEQDIDVLSPAIPQYMQHLPQTPLPYMWYNEKRKPTRFQCFMQRIFGLKPEKTYRKYFMPDGHVYASSDNNITRYCSGGRRRRRLRIRRLKRAKKINSESTLMELRRPNILTYVQSVQRSCLMDVTPRQCPIMGCRMMFYGIINYNDHLNLCHFTDRKFVCHYCHDGFQNEYDKNVHENEHIGITKLNFHDLSGSSSDRKSSKKVSNTQTEPHLDVAEEKLKKIVSFFDKIVDNEAIITDFKNNRYSESNLQALQRSVKSNPGSGTGCSEESTQCFSEQRTVSCGSLTNGKKDVGNSSQSSEITSKRPVTPVKCRVCGENFDYRRQLSLHVDLEHRIYNKFSKFHSCAGIMNQPVKLKSITQDDCDLMVHRKMRHNNSSSTLTDAYDVCRRKSLETLSCDPSTNIIYYESMDTMAKKPSVMSCLVQKVKSGIANYKWESGTKIIRI